MHSHLLQDLSNTDRWLDLATTAIINVVVAILIFYCGRFLVRMLVRFVTRGMRGARADETLVVFLEKLLRVLGIAVVIIAILAELGVSANSVAAVLGGAALAIGLALQNQLASFAAGVLLVTFRPIRVGDWVEAGGKTGTVSEINMFSTALTNFENQLLFLPNAKVWGDTIINYTRNGWRRLDLTVGIGYESDLLKAKQVLQELIAAESRVRSTPPPEVAVKTLGENSVDLAVRLCVNTPDAWPVQSSLFERIKLRFDMENIELPRPQMNLHVRTLPDPATAAMTGS